MQSRRAMLAVLFLLLGDVAAEPLLQLHGFVDTYYAANFNRPAPGESFALGAGTSGRRSGEFRINLAEIDVSRVPSPVGFHLSLAYGTGIDALHAAEPFLGAIYEAYASARVPVGRGLSLDAGIFASHVGFEGFFSKDNLNYTRSWMGEFSPYYQAGLRASYFFDEHWSAQLHLLNGWQLAGDDNRAKTLGTQLAWAGERGSVTLNTLIGPELAGDDTHWRFFGDLVAQVRLLEVLTLAATADAGLQQRPGGDATWQAAALYGRFALGKILAVCLRVELYRDAGGAISGVPQTLREGTATLEIRPADSLIIKLEARHDWSSAAIFASPRAANGAVSQLTRETLALASVVASL
jgi:hypothetical protein